MIGAAANFIAYRVSSLLNSVVTFSSKTVFNNSVYNDMTLSDFIATDVIQSIHSSEYSKFIKESTNNIIKATGQWSRSIMYSIIYSSISSFGSGRY